MAGQGAQAVAGGRIPELRGSVVAGGGEQLAVGAERHAVDSFGVAGQGANALAGDRIQSFAVLSMLAVASSRPSGLNATP